jgi:hypothetical protein
MAVKEKTFKASEVEAMAREIARKMLAEAKEAEKNAKAERKAALEKPGLSMIPVSDKDTESNVLARCVYVVPGVCVIHGTAVMVKHGEEYKARIGLAVNPIFGIPGDTDTDDERLIAGQAAKAEHAAKMVAELRKAYVKAAKSHTFNVRKKKGE